MSADYVNQRELQESMGIWLTREQYQNLVERAERAEREIEIWRESAQLNQVLRAKLEKAREDARAYKDAWMQARQAQMAAELRAAEVREENERMRAVVDAAKRLASLRDRDLKKEGTKE